MPCVVMFLSPIIWVEKLLNKKSCPLGIWLVISRYHSMFDFTPKFIWDIQSCSDNLIDCIYRLLPIILHFVCSKANVLCRRLWVNHCID